MEIETRVHATQESKVDNKRVLHDDIVHVPGFESFFAFHKTKKGYSGTLKTFLLVIRIENKVPLRTRRKDSRTMPVIHFSWRKSLMKRCDSDYFHVVDVVLFA